MIIVSIKKDGQVTNQGSFDSMQAGQEWLAYHEGLKTFGQKAEVIQQQVETQPAVIDEQGVEISPAQYEMQEISIPGYEVEIEDKSAELAQQAINAEAQKFLDGSDWKVLRHRDQQELGLATSLSSEEFQELLRQRQMAREAIVK